MKEKKNHNKNHNKGKMNKKKMKETKKEKKIEGEEEEFVINFQTVTEWLQAWYERMITGDYRNWI